MKPAREIDGNPDEITRVHDKIRSRIPEQRLVTRDFVEFKDRHPMGSVRFFPDRVLEDFTVKK